MEWENVPDDISEYVGFVYCITNLTNGKKYIGKKNFWRTKKLPPLKGKKNKRHSKVETDWRQYYGSCNKLLKDVEELGEDNFKREIIECHTCKFDLAYAEAQHQFDLRVLFSNDYYNEIINIRLRKRKD
jgi:hypothetical protein